MLLQPERSASSTLRVVERNPQLPSTEAGIVSFPPISSFTALPSQSKQFLHEPTIDAGTLGVGE